MSENMNENMEMMDMGIDQSLIDSYAENEQLDPNEEKLKEMNKKLPKWSLEPPQGFLK